MGLRAIPPAEREDEMSLRGQVGLVFPARKGLGLMREVERHESYRGRTTPVIEWRVWNADHTCYMVFKTKREAVAYARACEEK